jgi:predicted anti-sigma-YlaC factor YlaD
MDCRAFERDAVALNRDELSPGQVTSMKEHLNRCEKCRKLSAALAEVAQEVQELGSAELSPRFWPELRKQIEEADRLRGGSVSWAAMTLRLRPVAVAAGLAFGIWAGVWLGDAYVTSSSAVVVPEGEQELLPYLAVLDDVPRGSFAEMIVETSFEGESKP